MNYEEFVQYYISEMETEIKQNQTRLQKNGYEIAGYSNEETTVPCAHCVDKPGAPAIHCASAYGHVECLEALIANGALNVLGKSNRTAIFCAAANNHFHCVAILLDGVEESILNYQDKRGDTAVHAASATETMTASNYCYNLVRNQISKIKGSHPISLGKDCKMFASVV